jgi:fucose 4-O-acetylase-like acetyltransferase
MSGGSETSATRNHGAKAADMPVAGAATAALARERLEWVDALKGIGIIAVVAGHTWWRGTLHDLLYSFHMPLFFMLSGAVSRYVPLRQLLPRLLRTLGLPFLSFSILLLGADFVIEGLRGIRPIFPSIEAGALTILLSTQTLRGPFAILWFAPCLFFARLVWNGLLAQHWDVRAPQMLVAMAVIALLAEAADLWGSLSPLGLLPVPIAVILLWAGAAWKEWRPGSLMKAVLVAVALITLAWAPPVNLRSGDLGWPVVSVAGAVAIVYWLGLVAKQLPDSIALALSWIGRRSLVIMFTHTAILHYLTPYLPDGLRFLFALFGALLVEGIARLSKSGRLFLLGERI